MSYYLVSYDLIDEKDYKKLYDAIDKTTIDYIKLLNSLYLIKSTKDAMGLCRDLSKSLDDDDKLVVIETNLNDWATKSLSKAVNTKLRFWISS